MPRLRDRLRYQFLRSPLAPAWKDVRTITHRRQIKSRNALITGLTNDAHVRAAADELNRTGHVDLGNCTDPLLMNELAEVAHAKLRLGRDREAKLPPGTSKKAFWQRLLDDELIEGRMHAKSIYTRFALQRPILATIATATGSLPQLDYVLLTQSLTTGPSLSQSQLWHRDHDDVRTIKVFVYLTNVTSEGDGPFTMLPAAASDRIGRSLKSHRTDQEIDPLIKRSEIRKVFAPALTCFAVETSRCLHMGSRVGEGHSRLLYTATFTTFPGILAKKGNAFVLSGEESELERAVLAPEGLQ